ncbi:hypothetical protein CYMTET_14427 [Cymbomonas tetramitiformis]|uniref:Uncharacterized protein n=1 Tax=Cymbomonas tetramitiformis TaxID=36881 RepID=A0AAE0GGL0_9CHLO|nr:hypothetical protein CYMTET_14427 [Cymbomonas tetramitiformis]
MPCSQQTINILLLNHGSHSALTPTGSSGTRVAAKESTIPQQLNVERHRHLRQPLQQLSLFAEAQQQQRQRQPPKPVPPSKAKLCAQSSGRADQEDLFSSEKVPESLMKTPSAPCDALFHAHVTPHHQAAGVQQRRTDTPALALNGRQRHRYPRRGTPSAAQSAAATDPAGARKSIFAAPFSIAPSLDFRQRNNPTTMERPVSHAPTLPPCEARDNVLLPCRPALDHLRNAQRVGVLTPLGSQLPDVHNDVRPPTRAGNARRSFSVGVGEGRPTWREDGDLNSGRRQSVHRPRQKSKSWSEEQLDRLGIDGTCLSP